MKTKIRKGKSPFFGDQSFSHGLSRSGHFNKREADELTQYGHTMQALAEGSLEPENEEEALFVEEIYNQSGSTFYPAKLWQKYENAVQKSKVHHGFAKSNAKSNSSFGDNSSEFS